MTGGAPLPIGEPSSLRVLYFGLHGVFSRVPLQGLLAAGVQVCGIVVSSGRARVAQHAPIRRLWPEPQPGDLPLLNPYLDHGIIQMGWDAGIPVFRVTALGAPETVECLIGLEPHLGCVACFDQILPQRVLALPAHGFLNLHPSLLPAYRGPQPIFWLLRNAEKDMGVTLHVMNQDVDRGDIVAQESVVLDDGLSGAAIDERLAAAGAELLLGAIRQLERGELPRFAQPSGGSYYPHPSPADFSLDLRWSARHAFNFMRGTAHWGRAYLLEVAGRQLALRVAAGFKADAVQRSALEFEGRYYRIQFSHGILKAR